MSDDFDKEAEREKLREQFEAERQRRESTQQMSELLLKGATMTNKHCDDCGDPVFRHEGQEFCANCQTVATGDAADAAAAAGGGDAGAGADATGGPETAGANAAQADDGSDDDTPSRADEVPVEPQSREASRTSDRPPEGTPERSRERATDRSPERAGDRRDASAPRTRADEGESARRGRGRDAGGSPSPDAAPSADRSAQATDDVDAPAALQRSLEKFSRLAARTDDPREAKHHLEAAREAAEALAALRK